VVILFINCYSVNLATGVQNVFTSAKLVAILIVILGGMYQLSKGKANKSGVARPYQPSWTLPYCYRYRTQLTGCDDAILQEALSIWRMRSRGRRTPWGILRPHFTRGSGPTTVGTTSTMLLKKLKILLCEYHSSLLGRYLGSRSMVYFVFLTINVYTPGQLCLTVTSECILGHKMGSFCIYKQQKKDKHLMLWRMALSVNYP